MAFIKTLKKDIEDIIAYKNNSKKIESVVVYTKNLEYIEELLERGLSTYVVKDSSIYNRENFVHIEVESFSKKDIMILQRYLDYLNMIEN